MLLHDSTGNDVLQNLISLGGLFRNIQSNLLVRVIIIAVGQIGHEIGQQTLSLSLTLSLSRSTPFSVIHIQFQLSTR